MATNYSDQFYTMDPGNPPGPGTALQVSTHEFTDKTDDGIISKSGEDLFEGQKITHVWEGDTVTVNIPGQGEVTVTGVTFYVQGQGPVFTPTDGTNLQDATFVSSTYVTISTQLDLDDLAPACFTPGTWIDTVQGRVAVEQIRVGDLALTFDGTYCPVRWTGRRTVAAQGAFAPVCIARGAMGNLRDLVVSPQHRVLIQGWTAQLYAGQDEVLVAACHLTGLDGISRMPGGHVTYLHLGFDAHALIRSEGLWTESHFASAAARAEKALFPDPTGAVAPVVRAVRPTARKAEAYVMSASRKTLTESQYSGPSLTRS
jgi:hypothetical protein